MPKGEAVFYVGRVVKGGVVIDKFIEALVDALPYSEDVDIWSILGVEKKEIEGIVFYSGKLTKARPDTEYKVLSEDLKREEEKKEKNMVIASSSFIYIPDYSGIAFQSIPNHIEPKHFVRWFTKIIENTLGNLFVQCEIKLIDDLGEFYNKISKLEFISVIKTVVHPPNPLFGKFWEPLKQYLIERQIEEYQQKEVSKKKGLKCDIAVLLKLLIEGDQKRIDEYLSTHQVSHSDLAILMSLDGYGDGRIDGSVKGKHVYVKTHEKVVHFTLPSQFSDEMEFNEALEVFKGISNERYMQH